MEQSKCWFETTIITTNEEGKKTSESYLFRAVSHADAETQCIASHGGGEDFEVSRVVKRHYAEVRKEDGYEKFYACKVQTLTLDDNGGEKRKTVSLLVGARDITAALGCLKDAFGGTEYEVLSLVASSIIETYDTEADGGEQ